MTSTNIDQTASVKAILATALRSNPDKIPSLLAFEGRERYLAFVAAWKVVYAATVEEIRQAKRDRKDSSLGDYVRWSAQGRRESLRYQARTLLIMRKAGKDIARVQRTSRIQDAA